MREGTTSLAGITDVHVYSYRVTVWLLYARCTLTLEASEISSASWIMRMCWQ